MLSLALGVLPDELKPDLGLAHSHAIGEQHAAVLVQDALKDVVDVVGAF